MNNIIRKELNKVQVANLSDYKESEDKTRIEIFIPKVKFTRLEENKYYIIELNDSLLTYQENSLLITNWNNGSIPPFKAMKVDVSKVMGKMAKVTGLGYIIETDEDINQAPWTGWLPISEIKVIREL